VKDADAKADLLRQMNPFVEREMLPLLKSTAASWQPSDYIPGPESEGWPVVIDSLREGARRIPDDLLVAVVGNAVTEEALPSYQSWVNRLRGVGDATGTDDCAWARWIRGWSAEENRHGALLCRYLYLCGRVDMKSVERTVQGLIRNGFNAGTGDDPYMGLMYTAFQERATKISHSAAGNRAWREFTDSWLSSVCGIVASDEARHEAAYVLAVREIFEQDPDGAMLALKETVRAMTAMPGRTMDDGRTEGLYDVYSEFAERAGVYSVSDFAGIISHLMRKWGVERLSGLSAKAERARDFVCRVARHYERQAVRKSEAYHEKHIGEVPWVRPRSTSVQEDVAR